MSETNSTLPCCSRCGRPLPVGCLAGHCSRCLVETSFRAELFMEEPNEGADELPREFGDYQLLSRLGSGGMGVVFRARQTRLDREVALKMLPGGEFAQPEARQRFHRECLAAARLQHPNIVPIYEVGEQQGVAFLTMELVDGRTLAAQVAENPLPATTAARYLRAVAEAVHFAHGKGILHRDLKPSNILLDAFDQPRLTDFGLARPFASESELTRSRQVLGSPAYMSPEQALGRDDALQAATDIYGLGAVLYHVLTGRPPFQGDSLNQVLIQVQNAEPISPRRLNPSVPVDLETICLKCLEKKPSRRYATAAEVASELSRFLAQEPILARPLGRVGRTWRWCVRNRALAASLLVLPLAFSGGLGGVLWGWHRAKQSEQETRRNLYAADIKAASWAMDHGDLGLARHLLAAYWPATEEKTGASPKTSEVGRQSQTTIRTRADLRGFEWRYLWQRCQGQQSAILPGHSWIVTCTAFSPDGQRLASGGQDGVVRLWDPTAQKLVTNVAAHQGAVWSVAFSPEGDLFVTSGSDHKVRLWTAQAPHVVGTWEGQLAVLSRQGPWLAIVDSSLLFWEPAGKISLWDYRANHKLRELPDPGKALAFSPDGRTLAVTGRDRGVRLWDVASGKCVQAIQTEDQVWSPDFSPAGHELLVAARGKAFVWSLPDALKPAVLEHPLRIWAARFSPSGNEILTASSDRGIRLWNATNLTLRSTLWGHTDEIWCAAYSPDGKMIATGGKDQTVRLWADVLLSETNHLPHTAFARPYFDARSRRLVTIVAEPTDTRSFLWDVVSRRQLAVMPGFAVGFSADGKFLLRPASSGRALECWSPDKRAIDHTVNLKLPPDAPPLVRLAFSSDWRVLCGAQANGLLTIFNAVTGQALGTVQWRVNKADPSPYPIIRALALDHRARQIAVSTEEEKVARVYELPAGREIVLEGHHDFISGLDFSPDDKLLATGSVDGKVKLWSLESGKEVATLAGHMEEATDVSFSPDGLTLVSIGSQSSVKFWQVATGRELLSLELPHAGSHLQLSPDNRYLAIAVGAERNQGVQLFSAPEPGQSR